MLTNSISAVELPGRAAIVAARTFSARSTRPAPSTVGDRAASSRDTSVPTSAAVHGVQVAGPVAMESAAVRRCSGASSSRRPTIAAHRRIASSSSRSTRSAVSISTRCSLTRSATSRSRAFAETERDRRMRRRRGAALGMARAALDLADVVGERGDLHDAQVADGRSRAAERPVGVLGGDDRGGLEAVRPDRQLVAETGPSARPSGGGSREAARPAGRLALRARAARRRARPVEQGEDLLGE